MTTNRSGFRPLAATLLALLLLSSLAIGQQGTVENPAFARTTFGKLPLYFVENRGIYPEEVKYYIQGADKTLFFTWDGVTFALKGKERAWTVKLDFVGANKVEPQGREKQQAVFSYFKGPEKDWKTGLPTFSKVVYRDLWPGIDLVYRGTVNRLKYEFVVAPGADPTQIRLRYRGVEKLERTNTGALMVTTPEGGFEDAPPMAWQVIDGRSVPVEMAYALGDDAAFAFDLGEYDRTKPLVLDPAVIVYCGYVGGTSSEDFHNLAVDTLGNVYMTGHVGTLTSATFPAKVGPDLTGNGGYDAYVAKVRADGRGLEYCGYIGGSGHDEGWSIAVDTAGSAYVVGSTTSDEKTFPVKWGPDLTHNGGGFDGYIAKVNPQGTALDYCGYIGGDAEDQAKGIAIDGAGRACVSGETSSSASTFPLKVGPDLTHNGATDVFVARVDASGTSLDYCGYIGGSDSEWSWTLAVDSTGNAYVGGWTRSSEATFPVKTGPDLTHNGAEDGFIAKVNSAGTALVFCGYVGGAGHDFVRDVVVDAAGSAFVGGGTASDERSFPVRVGPDLTYNGGALDAYVAKVASSGASLVFCGYVGGAGRDGEGSVGIDSHGHAYLAGVTDSDERSFPVKVGPDLTHNGSTDVFVAKVDRTGTGLVYCGYIGGSGSEHGRNAVVDAAGNVYVGGLTTSSESSFPVRSGPALIYGGNRDAYVAKVAHTLLEASGAPRPGGTVNLTLTATDDAGLPYAIGSSLGTGPIPIGNRLLDLSPDDLLVVTANNYLPTIFAGYRGLIGTNGQATAAIHIPADNRLIGLRIHTAFVTVSPSAPFGLKSISNTFSFTI